MEYRVSALRALNAMEVSDVLLRALVGLASEAQVLGADNPAYQAAIAAIDFARDVEMDELFGSATDVLRDCSAGPGCSDVYLMLEDVVGVSLSAPEFQDRSYGKRKEASACQYLQILQASGVRTTLSLSRAFVPAPIRCDGAQADIAAGEG